mmetsp:Transcript_14184/g.42903  ORF Transcript_14184/g.42903 Transcript_14184/m.42903 type:complete len:203 (-) Transcript_14184:342-950(-)
MASVWVTYARAVREFGWKGLYEKCTAMGTVKFGEHVGTDKFGNKYFEDRNEVYGQHRWVEYKDIWNYDAASVPPAWQGWLCHMYDEPGHELERDVLARSKHTAQISTHDDGIYEHHIGHMEAHPDTDDLPVGNLTQYRQRGYGIPALLNKPGDPDLYYKQPGSATSDEYKDYKSIKGYEAWDPKKPDLEDSKVRPIRSLDEV